MTTRPDQHDPLDAEERELAARLARMGPIDGPSPALDARILAAAHAAAAAHRPRRHGKFAWLGLPPALVTGIGVAAAAVLALGLVWQLRPQYGHNAARVSAGADEELIIMAEPLPAARAPAANPPPAAEPSVALVATPQAPASRAKTATETAELEHASAPMADATAKATAPAAPGASAATAAAPAAEAVAADAPATAEGFSAEPPPAAAPAATSARKSHATYTTAARAMAERRARGNREEAAAAQAAEADAATLDRVEVTGSRIRRADADAVDWTQVPVNDDTHLPAAEWLERVRARRDADDLDNARASLRLFRREYPRVRIPDDLRALMSADASR
ncbi:hypothetical protein ACFPN1_05290 [Lysobacter yangpyeongensis]|uniref:Uncharacterized protein n=1 Tax=Lysobacter yangpyeongensis TaxID=346182 RepID=A0ABW0SLI8_9GAMM